MFQTPFRNEIWIPELHNTCIKLRFIGTSIEKLFSGVAFFYSYYFLNVVRNMQNEN